MRAAESRDLGWKRQGGGEDPALGLAPVLSAPFGSVLPLRSPLAAALRKLILVAVAISLAFPPLPAAFAHGIPADAVHAGPAEQEAAEHGHSHDAGGTHGPFDGHTHGHDPADHSHQYAFLAGVGSQWGLPPPQRWPAAPGGRPDAAISLGIERPPKQVAAP